MSNVMEHDLAVDGRRDSDITKNLYLAFVVDDEQYAVEVSSIKEIIGVVPITIVPQTENYLKGIINLRGDIIPVIDVRSRFRKPEIPYDTETCIVVVLFEDYILGLIVDRIIGVYELSADMVAAPPNAKLSYSNQFVKNIGRKEDGVLLLLDLEKILFV
ncbi:MAG: chemotaxis protein CheW [Defluviitaleaceae bacterium]|nr:chemotaxis protein CheW [Defluviitaleaceae bacterium]